MKLIFSITFTVFSLFARAQSAPDPRPQTVESTTSAISPAKITAQAGNWKQLVLQQPGNADAWFNYYNWVDRDKTISTIEKKNQLKEAVTSSRQYIAGSWQYSLMLFLQSNKRDSSALFNAVKMSDEKNIVYPYVVQFAVIVNNPSLLKQYCEALDKVQPLTKAHYEYHYNTLMSAEKNAVIYAKGLNDMAPMAILQQVYGVRKDIVFRYYENKTEEDAYLCLSLGKEILAQYPGSVYAGLLVKTKMTGKGQLEKSMENFSFSYLDAATSLTEEDKLIYRNYLPSMLLLYRNFLANNNAKAAEYKSRIDHLAILTGTTAMVNNLWMK